jgi:hypothetical protein
LRFRSTMRLPVELGEQHEGRSRAKVGDAGGAMPDPAKDALRFSLCLYSFAMNSEENFPCTICLTLAMLPVGALTVRCLGRPVWTKTAAGVGSVSLTRYYLER